MISLSLVTPLYNEEKNLPRLLSELESYAASQHDFALELVFVSDGSTDKTNTMLEAFAGKHPGTTQVISYSPNRGRGYALRKGMLSAKGDWRVVLDADLAAPLSEIKKLIPYIENGCELIVGSRRLPGARVESKPSILRSLLSLGFIGLARIATGVRVTDYSCGFKCFSKRAAEAILPRTKIERWAHDAENLYLAKKLGFTICEVPLVWRNGPQTTVRVFGAVASTLYDLLRLRLIHRGVGKG
jgi:dolichyl-phosphate beta-glucosyltransferase